MDGPGDQWMKKYMKETDHLPSYKKGTLVTYKEKSSFGNGTKRYEKEAYYGGWVKRNPAEKSKSRQFKSKSSQGAFVGIGTAADKVFLHEGIGVSTKAEVNAEKVGCDTSVAEVAGLKFLGAGAGAGVGNAAAGASATPVEAQAFAKTSGAEASAHAGIVEGVLEAKARAVAAEAQARAGIGLVDLGARAEASVTVAKVEAELTNVPFAQTSASGPEAKAETGLSWKYAGASVGAYAGEARAGPLAVRAGVKFGVGLRNGVPEVDAGPLTVPCSIM